MLEPSSAAAADGCRDVLVLPAGCSTLLSLTLDLFFTCKVIRGPAGSGERQEGVQAS